MDNIAAVVVTYNRLLLLKECIESLKQQTRKLDAILVINNGSTDGTKEWLDVQQGLKVIHQQNSGGAGGFYRGMKEGYELGYDWIWFMDDDVEPLKDCLEKMLSANTAYNNKYDVLQPDRKFLNSDSEWIYGSVFNFYNPFKPEAIKNIKASEFKDEKIKTIVSFPFEGPMFSRKVIEKVGYADPRYFIWYDDTDYSARVYFAGFTVGLVREAQMIKKIKAPEKGIKVDWKMYYQIRNQIIFDRKFGNSFIAVSRAAYNNLYRILLIVKQSIERKSYTGLSKECSDILKAMLDGFRFKYKT